MIGGARSGKSRYAQGRAEALGLKRVFVATAEAFDDEMHARISRHRADRGQGWETVEEPLDLARIITMRSAPDNVLLVDCLTLWTSNLILAERDRNSARSDLTAAIKQAEGSLILVANEVGYGIVPDNALARRFRDEAGLINQRVAEVVDEVQLVLAGLPMRVK